MADDDSSREKVGEAETPQHDVEVYRWIKNVGALVTIFAALCGIWVSVEGLRDKAKAEERAAEAIQKAEEAKLEVATLQIEDQRLARKDAVSQHIQDNALVSRKYQLDIQHEEKVASAAEKKLESDRLSAVISHMFSSNSSSEGDIAALFEHLDRDDAGKQIAENAVLARLENPRSKEEIDLGFRLLERIGYGAVDISAEVNRSARRKFDACLLTAFYDVVVQNAKPKDVRGEELSSDAVTRAEEQVAASTTADRQYVFATINHLLAGDDLLARKKLPVQTPISECPQNLAIPVMERSSLAIAKQVKRNQTDAPTRVKADQRLDLTEIYLTLQGLNGIYLSDKNLTANYRGGYVPLPIYPPETDPDTSGLNPVFYGIQSTASQGNPSSTHFIVCRAPLKRIKTGGRYE